MNHPYDFDDIDDYVHGRMSDADLKAFEEALAQDTDLAQQVEAVRAEDEILGYLRKEALMEEFGKWGREDMERDKRSPGNPTSKIITIKFIKTFAFAASIALMVIASWWWNRKNEWQQLEDIETATIQESTILFIEQMKGYGNDGIGVKDSIRLMNEIARKLNEGDLQRAITILEELKTEVDPKSTRLLYLTGLTLYKQKRFAEVIETLAPLIDHQNSFVRQSVQWFTALSLIKTKKIAPAKELLFKIVNDSKPYSYKIQDSAKSLLDIL